jgi:hypothetical protein
MFATLLMHAGPLGHLHPVDMAGFAVAAAVGALHIVKQVKAEKKTAKKEGK